MRELDAALAAKRSTVAHQQLAAQQQRREVTLELHCADACKLNAVCCDSRLYIPFIAMQAAAADQALQGLREQVAAQRAANQAAQRTNQAQQEEIQRLKQLVV